MFSRSSALMSNIRAVPGGIGNKAFVRGARSGLPSVMKRIIYKLLMLVVNNQRLGHELEVRRKMFGHPDACPNWIRGREAKPNSAEAPLLRMDGLRAVWHLYAKMGTGER